jgi:hypothetical protein
MFINKQEQAKPVTFIRNRTVRLMNRRWSANFSANF